MKEFIKNFTLAICLSPLGLGTGLIIILAISMAYPFFIFLIVIAGVIYFINKLYQDNNKQHQNALRLDKMGFTKSVKLESNNEVYFDEKQRKIAFVFSDALLVYDYGQILNWEWQWIEKNAVKKNNQIAFTINDREYPLLKISFSYACDAEAAMARIAGMLTA